MKRIFTAAVMAVAALTGVSLAGASAVSASASSQAATARIGNQYNKGSAGYAMAGGGWRFRYIKTTLTVPASSTRASTASLVLGNDNDAVVFSVDAGGGPGSIRYWISYDEGGTLAVEPNVGDLVTLSIYHDRAAKRDYFTAVDHTQGTHATGVLGANQTWLVASLAGGGPTWSLAGTDTRLWAFQDIGVTSYSGTHGTLLGPWPASRVIGTRGGTSTGAIVLWPTYPWNNGHNFSVVWRASS